MDGRTVQTLVQCRTSRALRLDQGTCGTGALLLGDHRDTSLMTSLMSGFLEALK